MATPMPMANHFEVQRFFALRSGGFHSTAGAAQAPRCLNRKPKFVKKAHRSASNMPICTVMKKEERLVRYCACDFPLSLFDLSGPAPSPFSALGLIGRC